MMIDEKMPKKYSFNCKDMGMDCDFKAENEKKDALIAKIGEHAKKAHNLEVNEELMKKVEHAIKKV